jgi:hypothetical protein
LVTNILLLAGSGVTGVWFKDRRIEPATLLRFALNANESAEDASGIF